MEYLIKSLKWTKHYKQETWWCPERNGYTYMICDAGIYTEKDKYDMTSLEKEKTILFVPLTQKLINKGKRQIENKLEGFKKDLTINQDRYVRAVNEINGEIKKLTEKKAVMASLVERVR